MAVNPDTTVRKVFSLPKETWEAVENFRFEKRCKTEAEAIRRLLSLGLLTELYKMHAETSDRALQGLLKHSKLDGIKKKSAELIVQSTTQGHETLEAIFERIMAPGTSIDDSFDQTIEHLLYEISKLPSDIDD